MFTLRITNLNDAPGIALGWADKTVSLVNSSGIANPFFGEGHQVFIMDDLDSERQECPRPGMQHAPKMKDIRNVLHFTETFTDEDKVLIHCHAGLCRSTAVAFLALVQHGMTAEQAMDKVVEVRPNPSVCPNILIVRLGDFILEQNGVLIRFMTDWLDAHPWTEREDD